MDTAHTACLPPGVGPVVTATGQTIKSHTVAGLPEAGDKTHPSDMKQKTLTFKNSVSYGPLARIIYTSCGMLNHTMWAGLCLFQERQFKEISRFLPQCSLTAK